MKITSQHINIVLAAVIIIILLLPKKGKQVLDRSGEIAAKDEVIKSIERERDTYREWKDSEIARYRRIDSALQNSVKQTIIKYEKIPATISRYNNDELRRAVENY
jgi:cell division FtsZ-interacting protein ZapD